MTLAEHVQLLSRNAEQVIPERGLEEKLAGAQREKRQLIIKLGIDPTAPDIHLGFAVVLRKLRQFQDLGHKVVFIVGDFTARIGDPTGRSQARPALSEKDITKNAETYKMQALKILDGRPSRLSVRHNSEWLEKLRLAEIIALAGKTTVAQIMDRDDFQKRMREGKSIGLHELFYPLMQAYDSVAIEADIELGGTDQTFNLLMGRQLQQVLGHEPQTVLTLPLLVGLDGQHKMSKSLGNYIGITEPAEVMFGKVMSLPDALVPQYLRLATDLTKNEITTIEKTFREGEHLMDIKLGLAYRITRLYHTDKEAQKAKEAFISTFSKREFPDDAPVLHLKGSMKLLDFLTKEYNVFPSGSEARRKISEGAVQLNGQKITDVDAFIAINKGGSLELKVGKRQFYRIVR